MAKDEESDRQALEHYDLAIAADPTFAMAHAARSRVTRIHRRRIWQGRRVEAALRGLKGRGGTIGRIGTQARRCASRAGFVLFTGYLNVKGARPSYERAYQLGRGNSDIVLLYALYCSRAGLPEQAHIAIERALVLDPINARVHRAAGSIDYAARQYGDALPPLRRALELNSKISNAHALLGYCLMQLGKLKEARAEFDAEPTNFFRLSGLAIVDQRLGNKAEADRAMDQLLNEMETHPSTNRRRCWHNGEMPTKRSFGWSERGGSATRA
jgi:tetratricopeptide (TPR) repeat protein